MPTLFIAGNTNQHTFANAILAADVKERDRCGKGLTGVFVVHSPESERYLARTKRWKQFLRTHGLNLAIFSSFITDLKDGEKALDLAVSHIERALCTLNRNEDIYVDLTNGHSI